MLRRCTLIAAAIFACATVSVLARQAPTTGWNIPPNAAQETNPVAGDAQAISEGKQLFGKNCQHCHGPGGKGDGPDANPDLQEDMDLTLAERAARNPDGVVFYKAWNGRAKPKMPAFSEKLSKDDVWKIVAYVETLRDKQ
ncbi:MAG: c-type cytochrome [Vicinamibacterales bacterium]